MIPTRDVSGWNVGDHEGAFSRFAGVGWGETGLIVGVEYGVSVLSWSEV